MIGQLDPDGHSWLPAAPAGGDTDEAVGVSSRPQQPTGGFAAHLAKTAASPAERAAAVSSAARLLLCEDAPAGAVAEDLAGGGDPNAVAHLLGQLFLGRPALPLPPAAAKVLDDGRQKLRERLKAARGEWSDVRQRGWREDGDLVSLTPSRSTRFPFCS